MVGDRSSFDETWFTYDDAVMRRWKRVNRVPEPVPPENVRLVNPDGTEIPLECRYAGIDEQGIHMWVVVAPQEVRMRIGETRLSIDMLPSKTGIRLLAK
jgi:hypothetical protein